MKSISPADYKITTAFSLADLPTVPAFEADKDEVKNALNDVREQLSELQDTMYAHNKYSMLICLQGMDTSGKDSLIREVFKEMNPRGVVVHSFKTPSSVELEHDYLWRHYIALPERGKIAVFNRSHYENVLVTRVHPEYLLSENLPEVSDVSEVSAEFWKTRFEQINNFERHLVQNGTIVIKIFLHLSKEEQRKRLLRRLEELKHNWKFSEGDLKERELWSEYMKCYEDAINNTSKENAPWFVVPADDKKLCRYITAEIILQELQKYKDIIEPKPDDDIFKNVAAYRKQLEKE
ncbi:MAG TPA: PPK2 family polyphosphate kinase [Flavobacterium sp.]|jgi:PPK2 family polyphosphate:nucleotide phosphotransferase